MKKRMPLFPGMAGLTRGDILRLKAGGGDLLSVVLMLTQKCNFKCLYCYADGAPGKTQGLSMAEAKKLARQALRLGVKILNMQGGEPFMWRPADWKGGEEPLFHLMEHIKALYAADGLPVNLVSFTDAALITQARAQRLAALDVD